MISIHVDSIEYYDDDKGEFFTTPSRVLNFEHSLKSISEWESVYKIPLLTHANMSNEEFMYYVQCMSLDDDFDYIYVTPDVIGQLIEYLKEVPTATTINKNKKRKSNGNSRSAPRVLTSEVIYAYMANGQIPFECDRWNIHRLLTLLDVIGELNSPPEKMSPEEIMKQQSDLNAQRRAMLGSSG